VKSIATTLSSMNNNFSFWEKPISDQMWDGEDEDLEEEEEDVDR